MYICWLFIYAFPMQKTFFNLLQDRPKLFIALRWLNTVSSTFQDVDFDVSL